VKFREAVHQPKLVGGFFIAALANPGGLLHINLSCDDGNIENMRLFP
jgi:hypothetical protein